MVHLNRIYTRTGDDGSTALGDGSRLPKHDLRIASYGTVDELSAVIGLLLTEELPASLADSLQSIQNDLFDVGADLCVPGEAGEKLRITPKYTAALERLIDAANADLEPLNSFILPGGTRASAWLHLARTVCRRAERLTCELADRESDKVNAEVIHYLNRLSDLFFVLGRLSNNGGRGDVLWKPGGGKHGDDS